MRPEGTSHNPQNELPEQGASDKACDADEKVKVAGENLKGEEAEASGQRVGAGSLSTEATTEGRPYSYFNTSKCDGYPTIINTFNEMM